MNIITALTALMLFFALCPWNTGSYEKSETPKAATHSTVEYRIVTPDAIIYPQSDDYEIK